MLSFKPFESSSIWQFPDPDSGRMHVGKTRAELVQNITGYRAQNNLEPIVRLDLVLNHYLCSLPTNVGKCKQEPLKRGFMQYMKGGLALVQQLFYGENSMVGQEEADRRAAVCKDCACNIFPDHGMFIQWSDDLALHTIGDRKSKLHAELGNCSGCSCPLRCKVWHRGPFVLSVEEVQKMKAAKKDCWQLHVHS
jgi:hypothetical protein